MIRFDVHSSGSGSGGEAGGVGEMLEITADAAWREIAGFQLAFSRLNHAHTACVMHAEYITRSLSVSR